MSSYIQTHRHSRRKGKGGVVYFMQHRNYSNHVKIGYSCDLVRRFKNLNKDHKNQLECIVLVFTPNPRRLELYFHKRFSFARIKNEFFYLTRYDISTVLNEHKDFGATGKAVLVGPVMLANRLSPVEQMQRAKNVYRPRRYYGAG